MQSTRRLQRGSDDEEKFFRDNTEGMDPRLAERYRDWVPMIQAEIQAYFPRNPNQDWFTRTLGLLPSEIDSDYIRAIVIEPTYLYVNRPGKLLRPILTGLILNAYGANVDKHLSVLAMIELMEVTTISMNDIWDDSIYRRDGYCTHVIYNKEIAHAAALAGYAYCLAFLFNNQYRLGTELALRLYQAFGFEDVQMFLGDVVETLWPVLRKVAIPQDHFFQEVASRCAFLSFRGPARIGAVLGGASEEAVRHFEMFGMLIGLAYHLRGDNLNIAPQSASWGKAPYEDITAGRRSLLTSFAVLSANAEDRREMLDILDSRTTDIRRINRFIELINRYEAARQCEQRAIELLETARTHLNQTGLPPEHQELLWAFSQFMVRRKK